MNDVKLYEKLLGLSEPWQVESVELKMTEKEIMVTVGYDSAWEWFCPTCGLATTNHDHVERRWRHLDSCQFKTMIRARVPRQRCETHGVYTVQVSWAESRSHFTLLFERFAIDVLKQCSVIGAAGLLGISWDEAQGILERAVKRGKSRKQQTPLKRFGIDEKSFAKRHNYVTLVVRLEEGDDAATVEHVGDGRSAESLDGFWNGRSPEQLKEMEAVALDMWEPYIKSVRDHLPQADQAMVFDRFHLVGHMVDAVDQVRRKEHREFQEMGFDLLKGTKYWWLYNEENLPAEMAPEFQVLKSTNLKVGRAWSLKETLRGLWDCRSVKSAREFFGRWYSWAIRSRLPPVKEVARMFKRHLDNIVTYIRHRITNAAAEGLNSKIQELKKRAYGFRNREHFKNAILFHCGGLDLYPELT